MKKLKMAWSVTLTFEEGCRKYLENCRQRNLREGIQKHSKDFGGSLEDPDVIKLCGCSRNSYYKYKRELKT